MPRNNKVLAERVDYAVDEKTGKIEQKLSKKDRAKYATANQAKMFAGLDTGLDGQNGTG